MDPEGWGVGRLIRPAGNEREERVGAVAEASAPDDRAEATAHELGSHARDVAHVLQLLGLEDDVVLGRRRGALDSGEEPVVECAAHASAEMADRLELEEARRSRGVGGDHEIDVAGERRERVDAILFGQRRHQRFRPGEEDERVV